MAGYGPKLAVFTFSFEVHGKVHGVSFGKHAEKKCKELGLVGWCAETTTRSIAGEVQGCDVMALQQMKEWLNKTGSPKSKIESCDIRDQREIPKKTYSSFKQSAKKVFPSLSASGQSILWQELQTA
ncbi:hypothetical protein CYMTET_34948 [Cymbomonas tetramitiformis]|uniref:acylphosphatase n=1 Tax=Cymbomonas tetramitiformis TaxID=36881 RepID=A0AAE0FA34_9CHLO|nr:hypothetical protein CYMTET_34948 [Cymbomonas tetramitiformis]